MEPIASLSIPADPAPAVTLQGREPEAPAPPPVPSPNPGPPGSGKALTLGPKADRRRLEVRPPRSESTPSIRRCTSTAGTGPVPTIPPPPRVAPGGRPRHTTWPAHRRGSAHDRHQTKELRPQDPSTAGGRVQSPNVFRILPLEPGP